VVGGRRPPVDDCAGRQTVRVSLIDRVTATNRRTNVDNLLTLEIQTIWEFSGHYSTTTVKNALVGAVANPRVSVVVVRAVMSGSQAAPEVVS
jgi:hypothetical protein